MCVLPEVSNFLLRHTAAGPGFTTATGLPYPQEGVTARMKKLNWTLVIKYFLKAYSKRNKIGLILFIYLFIYLFLISCQQCTIKKSVSYKNTIIKTVMPEIHAH